MIRNRIAVACATLSLLPLSLLGGCHARPAPLPAPSATAQAHHPRLWLTSAELPRYRAWASGDNPVWTALEQSAARARGVYDKGDIPAGKACFDKSGVYPCESYAELFAFMSLVEPDEAQRRADAGRAVRLLMAIIDEAKKGARDDDDTVRGHNFAISDRSRWTGESFALTVDWVYPYLTAEQKHDIRTVFLRWADELEHASTTSHNHPEPLGVIDDPKLTADRLNVRYTANNYFTAHMRNLGLMALAFDPEDDAGQELRRYLSSATGAWLYMVDDLLRSDARGGLPPDGLEYGPQTYAYVAQFLLALHSAGADDGKREKQVRFDANPWWDELEPAWLHLVAPQPVQHPWMGKLAQPAWYGEGQKYWMADPVDLFAPLGLWARSVGDTKRYDAARFIVRNLAPGGADAFVERVAKNDDFRQPILYFLLFDPKAAPAPDPRPSLPLTHVAPGIGRIYARTDWGGDAAMFDYGLGWISIDHQHADGNGFELYRKGEWLTKERTGYGTHIACSDYHDTVAIENDKPYHAKDPNDYRAVLWHRGSQWPSDDVHAGGRLLAHSESSRYVYALGDATTLYNSKDENALDVQRAVRAIVWLAPDEVVVFDRAATKTDGRFKRFWLQLPALGTVSGKRMTMKTHKGQQLFVTTLLPADATPAVEPAEPLKENAEPAELDPIVARLKVESRARDVRFLHVLQGADGKASADVPQLVDAGPDFVAVAVHARSPDCGASCGGPLVVVFPRNAGDAAPASLALTPPAGTRALVVTGLSPGAGYAIERGGDGKLTLKSGGGESADGGGLLWHAVP